MVINIHEGRVSAAAWLVYQETADDCTLKRILRKTEGSGPRQPEHVQQCLKFQRWQVVLPLNCIYYLRPEGLLNASAFGARTGAIFNSANASNSLNYTCHQVKYRPVSFIFPNETLKRQIVGGWGHLLNRGWVKLEMVLILNGPSVTIDSHGGTIKCWAQVVNQDCVCSV